MRLRFAVTELYVALQICAMDNKMLVFDLIIAVAYFAIPLELLYCFLWYAFITLLPVMCIYFSLLVCPTHDNHADVLPEGIVTPPAISD